MAISLVQTSGTSFISATSPVTTASFTWLLGDLFVLVAVEQMDGANTTFTPSGGPAAGWTQRQRAGATSGTGSTCAVTLWTSLAASGSSGTISVARGSASGVFGARAWQFRGAAIGGSVANSNTTKTISLTTIGGGAGSWIVFAAGDFAGGTAPSVWTPASNHTNRDAINNAAYDVSTDDWSGQGAATTSYGVSTGFSAGGPYAKAAIELLENLDVPSLAPSAQYNVHRM